MHSLYIYLNVFSHVGPRHSEMVQCAEWIWLHKQVTFSLIKCLFCNVKVYGLSAD